MANFPQNSAAPSKAVMTGMAGCYAMGNFTDNFFKQAAVLMAAAASLTHLQSLATVLFAMPFIVFSAWAGWLADRVQKKSIVIWAKLLELLALALGAAALWMAWWPGILAVVFIMAVQSTIFIPALNGAIPENFAPTEVPRVNSIIRMISTAAILGGMAMAGPLLDARPGGFLPSLGPLEGAEYGRLAAGLFAVSLSVIGLALAFVIKPSKGVAFDGRPFPWLGPLDSLRHILEYRKDKQLFLVMNGDAFFYGLAPIVIISIANLAKELGFSDTLTSLLSASLMIGVAAGALIAGRSTPESWRRLMVPTISGMAFFLFLASLTVLLPESARLPWLAGALLLAGFCGGIYLIPITSYMQVRPKAGEKGKVLAASNFYSFLSMAVFGAAFGLIGFLPTHLAFVAYAVIALAFSFGWARPRLARLDDSSLKDKGMSIAGLLVNALLSLRYRVRESGLEKIRGDGRPLLFLPNHPALIDPIIVGAQITGLGLCVLSDEKRMAGLAGRLAGRFARVITIPDPMRDGKMSARLVIEGINRISAALKNGENVLLYPSGRIYHSQNEDLRGNSSVARILAAVPEARVILVRTSGLWGSSFSRTGGANPQFLGTLVRHIPALLANLIFFMPRREVQLEFCEAPELPRDKMALNHALEEYYNEKSRPAAHVPLYWWQKRTT